MTTGVGGQFIGAAGRSLTGATFTANEHVRKIGQAAEERTGQILLGLTRRGPSVINDIRIPIPGFKANIDHVIISGKNVIIVDTKQWAKGFYWTWRGVTRRGLSKFDPADRKTVPTAMDSIERFLKGRGLKPRMRQAALVVWTDPGSSFWAYKPQGRVRVVRGQSFERWLKVHSPNEPADHNILLALAELAN